MKSGRLLGLGLMAVGTVMMAPLAYPFMPGSAPLVILGPDIYWLLAAVLGAAVAGLTAAIAGLLIWRGKPKPGRAALVRHFADDG